MLVKAGARIESADKYDSIPFQNAFETNEQKKTFFSLDFHINP